MDGSPELHEPFLNPLHSFGSGVGFVFGGVRLAAILQLKSAKVTSGNMAQRAFWGRLADVMARYRRVTSAHHRQIRLRGLLADVTLPENEYALSSVIGISTHLTYFLNSFSCFL